MNTDRRIFAGILMVLAVNLAHATGYYTTAGFRYFVDTYNKVAYVSKYEGADSEVTIPAEMKMGGVAYPVVGLDDGCFEGNEGLKSVVISSPVKDITGAFRKCTELESVRLPFSVKVLDEAFLGCTKLKSINIPNSVVSMESTFDGCSSLEAVTLPNSVTNLKATFADCTSLTSVNIPSSVTSLPATFYGCRSLTHVDIPESVRCLGNNCFYLCHLDSMTIPSSVDTLGYRCFVGARFTKLFVPKTVKVIGAQCFAACSNMETLTVEAPITELDDEISSCRNLQSLSLPSTLQSVYEDTFKDKDNLFTVKFHSQNPPTMKSRPTTWPHYLSPRCQVFVPKESVEKYKASIWGQSCIYPLEVCKAPSVSYANGKLMFTSATQGTEYHYTVTPEMDCGERYSEDGFVSLAGRYTITVYATADGYEPSETVKATLVWLDANVNMGTGVSTPDKHAVVASSHDGVVTVSGLKEGEQVTFYTIDGKLIGTQRAVGGTASLSALPLATGVVIARIGNQSVKVLLK